MKTAILLLVMLTATVGCSTRYKSTDPQVSSEEMSQWLNEAAEGTQNFTANELLNDPATTIYFADTSIGTMGNVVSLLAFYNLNFFDPSVWIDSVGHARVFFLDNPGVEGSDEHLNMLIVGVQNETGTYTYKAFEGRGKIEGGNQWDTGTFNMRFTGGDELEYVLRSYDVQDGELTNDIQLKLYGYDDGGNEVYVGKFSILAGYQ